MKRESTESDLNDLAAIFARGVLRLLEQRRRSGPGTCLEVSAETRLSVPTGSRPRESRRPHDEPNGGRNR